MRLQSKIEHLSNVTLLKFFSLIFTTLSKYIKTLSNIKKCSLDIQDSFFKVLLRNNIQRRSIFTPNHTPERCFSRLRRVFSLFLTGCFWPQHVLRCEISGQSTEQTSYYNRRRGTYRACLRYGFAHVCTNNLLLEKNHSIHMDALSVFT